MLQHRSAKPSPASDGMANDTIPTQHVHSKDCWDESRADGTGRTGKAGERLAHGRRGCIGSAQPQPVTHR
eukprot:22021-Pleurochrysis_carterae.AAC.5